jgi:hypothetical protein
MTMPTSDNYEVILNDADKTSGSSINEFGINMKIGGALLKSFKKDDDADLGDDDDADMAATTAATAFAGTAFAGKFNTNFKLN